MKLLIKGLLTAVLFLAVSVNANVVEAPERPLTIKEKVELIFHDSPIMVRKLNCESGYRQFKEDGSPLVSPTKDFGVAQINHTWIPLTKEMGLDVINSEDDNLKFARYLYDKYGSGQWYAPSTPNCK